METARSVREKGLGSAIFHETEAADSAPLTVTAAPSSTAGAFAATVSALTESSDPIGTTATLGVTIAQS